MQKRKVKSLGHLPCSTMVWVAFAWALLKEQAMMKPTPQAVRDYLQQLQDDQNPPEEKQEWIGFQIGALIDD